MKKATMLAAALAATLIARPETTVIEAESFEDWGGWVNDTQFMDQMDSPYLLAHGLGKPVADAKMSFFVENGSIVPACDEEEEPDPEAVRQDKKPGVAATKRFKVMVRTMNWTARWSTEAAGTFKVAIDGKELPNVLGAGKCEWCVEEAGVVELGDGPHTLALHDLTGFDGRCDFVAFVDEADEKPDFIRPNPGANFGGWMDFDLCVVGGGIAGICTAVSAARLGLTVALVHDRPVLGGNNSSEVRVHLGSYQNLPPYPRLGDLLAEFGPVRGGNAETEENYEDAKKLAVVEAEKRIRLFLNTRMRGVATNETGAITKVYAQNTVHSGYEIITAKWFADCTGDGNLGYAAGADFRMGREAKGETGEPDAPEKADMVTMGASVQWNAGKASGDAAFPTRLWMLKNFNEDNCSPHLRGDWWWEAGLGRDQIAEAEYIRDYGLLVAFSNWAFVKNYSSKKGDFADKELKWVAYNAGRRESRRLLGDFILDQNHIRNKDFQPDGTCATTWTIDLHLPKSADESKFEGEPFQSNSLNEKIWPYPVPYRCLYSRNVPNLFMAGRDISVTHIALGTTRLMRTHGMMGEVVGMAASICKKHGCTPRDVYTSHLDELKALMTKGVGDGKKHPRQDYNVQESLDPEIKAKHIESSRPLVPELKVLMIGNSFSRPVVRTLPALAKSAGVRLDIASLYIGGCSLERHAKNIRNDAAEYLIERNNDGERLKKEKARIGEWLSMAKWDVVTIQQASHFSWRPETFEPWGDEVIAEIRRLAPQAEIVVQETWSYNANDGRLKKGRKDYWGFGQDEMYSRIHKAVGSFAKKRGLRVIPTGAAIQAARAKGGPDVVGNGGDTIHLNKAGEKIQAEVWLKTLFGAGVGSAD